MGNLISWSKPSSESTYTLAYIYRATSETGTYTELANQTITDNTYYDANGDSTHWYKIRFYDGTNDVWSSYSDVIQGSSITNYYTTPARVASHLGKSDGFSAQSIPNITEVMETIQYIEDEVDKITMNAWRSRTISNEYHDVNFPYKWGTGKPIYLNHRNIKSFDSDEGDKIEVWNGSDWEDWLDSDNGKSEGRDGDYWCEYELGVLWLKTFFRWMPDSRVRVTYRYGESTVPNDIKLATTMMVCAELAQSEDKAMFLAEGTAGLSLREKIEHWEKRAKEILDRYVEVVPLMKG